MKLNDSFGRHSSPAPHLDLFDPAIADLIQKSARKLSRSDGFLPQEAEDIECELIGHLLLKRDQYDASLAPPLAYANVLIKRKIVSIVRHRFGQRRDPRRVERSLDSVLNDGDEGAIAYHESLPGPDAGENHRLRSDIESVIEGLPTSAATEARRLLQLFESGKSVRNGQLADVHRAVLWREFAPLVDGIPPAPPEVEGLCVSN